VVPRDVLASIWGPTRCGRWVSGPVTRGIWVSSRPPKEVSAQACQREGRSQVMRPPLGVTYDSPQAWMGGWLDGWVGAKASAGVLGQGFGRVLAP
jgi:hypothetical protein